MNGPPFIHLSEDLTELFDMQSNYQSKNYTGMRTAIVQDFSKLIS